jgi:hypothetical protein
MPSATVAESPFGATKGEALLGVLYRSRNFDLTPWPSSQDTLGCKGQFVVGKRTIIVFLLAFSVAMLPVAGGIVAAGDKTAVSEVAVDSTHDCCDHDGMPTTPTMSDCQAGAGCAAKCFSLFNSTFFAKLPVPPKAEAELSLAMKPILSQEIIPPFRPPRI